jgi:GT2 family glycosyltransferase
MSKPPVITIGMPAYNSAAHSGLTLESFLSQTFTDFDLIVSDNASTDDTREVVLGAAVWRHHYPGSTRNALFQGCKRQAGRLRVALTAPMPPGDRVRSIRLVAKRVGGSAEFLLRDLPDLWYYWTRRPWVQRETH